eukprot:scaffold4945_cov46-Cyclotella_meneghiniana.AAC.4
MVVGVRSGGHPTVIIVMTCYWGGCVWCISVFVSEASNGTEKLFSEKVDEEVWRGLVKLERQATCLLGNHGGVLRGRLRRRCSASLALCRSYRNEIVGLLMLLFTSMSLVIILLPPSSLI